MLLASTGLLFAFLPYHSLKWEEHYFLSAYWVVPLSLLPCTPRPTLLNPNTPIPAGSVELVLPYIAGFCPAPVPFSPYTALPLVLTPYMPLPKTWPLFATRNTTPLELAP